MVRPIAQAYQAIKLAQMGEAKIQPGPKQLMVSNIDILDTKNTTMTLTTGISSRPIIETIKNILPLPGFNY